MRSRWVLFILLIGGVAAGQGRRQYPEARACKQQNLTCREDCTIEFGTSLRTRAKLGRCLEKCQSTSDLCVERWNELHSNNLDPAVMEAERRRAESQPIPEERSRYDDDLREDRRPSVGPEPAPRTRVADDSEASPSPGPEAYASDPPAASEGEALEPVESTRTRYADPETTPSETGETTRSFDEPGSGEAAPGSGGDDRRDDGDAASAGSAPAPAPVQASEARPSRHAPYRPELPPEPKEDISEWDPDSE